MRWICKFSHIQKFKFLFISKFLTFASGSSINPRPAFLLLVGRDNDCLDICLWCLQATGGAGPRREEKQVVSHETSTWLDNFHDAA